MLFEKYLLRISRCALAGESGWGPRQRAVNGQGLFGDLQHWPGVAGHRKALRDLMNSEETPDQNPPLDQELCEVWVDRLWGNKTQWSFLGASFPQRHCCYSKIRQWHCARSIGPVVVARQNNGHHKTLFDLHKLTFLRRCLEDGFPDHMDYCYVWNSCARMRSQQKEAVAVAGAEPQSRNPGILPASAPPCRIAGINLQNRNPGTLSASVPPCPLNTPLTPSNFSSVGVFGTPVGSEWFGIHYRKVRCQGWRKIARNVLSCNICTGHDPRWGDMQVLLKELFWSGEREKIINYKAELTRQAEGNRNP